MRYTHGKKKVNVGYNFVKDSHGGLARATTTVKLKRLKPIMPLRFKRINI